MAVTPRLNLNLPVDSQNVNVVDAINSQYRIIDRGMDAFPCTSTTRPTTNLFPGMLIFERDTKIIRSYSPATSTWEFVTGHGKSWGHISHVESGHNTPAITPGNESDVYQTMTFYENANRGFKLRWVASVAQTGTQVTEPTGFKIIFRRANGNVVDKNSPEFHHQYFGIHASRGTKNQISGFYEYNSGDGSTSNRVITVGMFLKNETTQAANVMIGWGRTTMFLEDIGTYQVILNF